MMQTNERFTLALPPKALGTAVIATSVAGGFLWAVWSLFGMHVAVACYLAMMLLLAPAHISRQSLRVLSVAWAVFVAVAGYLVGTHGLWATVTGLAIVSVLQALLHFGDMPALTRSPVNFLVFAGLALTDTRLDEVALGSAIGATFMLLAWTFLPIGHRRVVVTPQLRTRLIDGFVLAGGAVLTVVLLTWLGFHYVNWALISFCMIVAVSAGNREVRARERILGTLAGVLVGTAVSFLPMPAPLILSVVFMLLCVAYQLVGNYTMFVAFVTPAVLLLSSTDASTLTRGFGRLEAVLASAVIALLCTWLARRVLTRRAPLSGQLPAARHDPAPPPPSHLPTPG